MPEAERVVTVSVPATTANLGPGFDCLGLALELRNEFTLTGRGWVPRPEEVDLVVAIEGEGTRGLSRREDNLVYRAALAVFSQAGRYPARLSVRLRCAIPVGKGLGSSASAIVGGVWGAAALLGEELEGDRWLALAVKLEGHPDNVVPAVFGGFTIAVAGLPGEVPQHVAVPVAAPLRAVVAVPSFSLRTAEARRRLPRQVPLGDAVFNLAHTAAIVAGALRGDWASAAAAMEDRLHQPYRAPLVPGFAEVCAAARRAGAAAAVLSGAGPSVLALVVDSGEDGQWEKRCATVGEAMEQAFLQAGVKARSLVLEPAREGVRVDVAAGQA
ncbi:MAG: homoserine kinase [Bacillota bacterium]|nr:homoserine kinase [Bacillota bacterium]